MVHRGIKISMSTKKCRVDNRVNQYLNEGAQRPSHNMMFRFLHNTTAVPAQDVEMGIERELLASNIAEPSTHTTSHPPVLPPVLPPIPPQNEEMVCDPLPPKNTPEILAFMERQKKTIEAC